jgi:hypothetical protein
MNAMSRVNSGQLNYNRLIEEGGDWDRRNRLKVYEGIYKISIRDFKGAVDNLLDTLATFSSTELMEYKEFVKFAVLTGALTLKRPDFKKKVGFGSDVQVVIATRKLTVSYPRLSMPPRSWKSSTKSPTLLLLLHPCTNVTTPNSLYLLVSIVINRC